MIIRCAGLRFVADTFNFWSVYEVWYAGLYDRLLSRLRQDDVVLDGGANVGAFSLLASKRAAKVYAVEPDSANFRLLQRNLERNAIENVDARQVALLDVRRNARIEGRGIAAHIAESGVTVPAETIDSIAPDAKVIKLDIEGSEIAALAGATRVLQNVRMMIIETHHTESEVGKILLTNGFAISEVKNEKLKWASRKLLSPDFVANEATTGFPLLTQARNMFLNRAVYRACDTRVLFAERINEE